VLSQRGRVKEFFVLDGGSTDGSVEIIERHAADIDVWRSERDGGQSNAIADGLAMATVDVVTWLNSDDALLPGAVEAMLARFDADASVELVEGETVVIDAESRVIRCDRRAGPSARWMRHGYMRIHQPSTFFRRDVYEDAGGVDRSLHCVMDTDLWYRVLAGRRAERLQRYVGAHRAHGGAKGVSEAWTKRYRDERRLLAERYPELYNHSVRYQLGRLAFQWERLTTGRGRLAKAEIRRFGGRALAEVAEELVSL
jgi:glycosyltransferase involved in cell wall biosynthesis